MHKGRAVNLKSPIKVNLGHPGFFSGNRCFLCAEPCGASDATCRDCLNDLVFNSIACPRCARPGSAPKLCADCLSCARPVINNAWALFQYHYPINHLIQHMKFRQGIDIAAALGHTLSKALLCNSSPTPDCIIPVPLHPSKLITRGYNQSIEFARPLSRHHGIRLDVTSCKRIRATRPQSTMPAKKRKKNIRGAFFASEKIAYNHVLIVDDVITTGSTVNELALTLRIAGVSRVDVLVCARAV